MSADSLSDTYDLAMKLFHEVEEKQEEEKVDKAMSLLEECETLVRKESTFSKNEEVDDINTEDLKYLQIPFYLGRLLQKKTQNRLKCLYEAEARLTQFIDKVQEIEMLSKEDEKVWEIVSKSDHHELPDEMKREIKINRYRKEKECEKRIKEIERLENQLKNLGEGGIDESTYREKMKLMIESSVRLSMDDLGTVSQEIEILKHIEKMTEEGTLPPPPKPVPQHQGIDLFHISENMTITKEKFMGEVFRPDHILPTMTIEEFGDIEIQAMKDREAREAEEAKGEVMNGKQVREQGLEEDEELTEKARKKDSAWDDWCDDHPKGFGNTQKI